MMDWIALSLIHILLMGERYKMVTKETKDILLGKYGATVKPFNPEVQKKCIGDEKPITCRPADLDVYKRQVLQDRNKKFRRRIVREINLSIHWFAGEGEIRDNTK